MAEIENQQNDVDAAQARKQGVKLAIELGPLLVFFAVYWGASKFLAEPSQAIFWGTGFLIAATLLSLVASKLLTGHIPMMPLVTAALVTVFGGLTLYLQNDVFIKMKPTILYAMFAAALVIGLALKRFFLKAVFSEVMSLTDQGWRILTIRWALFFLCLAVINEFVWRTFSESTWVTYKVFGTLPLIMLFAATQIGLLKKYEVPR